MTRRLIIGGIVTVLLAALAGQEAHGAIPRTLKPALHLKHRPVPFCRPPCCIQPKKKPRATPRLYVVKDLRES